MTVHKVTEPILKIESKEKILLLDDDKSFCLLLQKIAARHGIQLEYCLTKVEFDKVELLEDFNSIWIDYDLLESTGLEIAEELNDSHPDMPVILVSGSTRPFVEETDDRANIKAMVSKWDLTDDLIGEDLILSTLGELNSFDGVKPGHVNTDTTEVESLAGKFDFEITKEKYRA